MRPVRFVALSEDGQALVLADEVGRLLALPIDDRVSTVLRSDRGGSPPALSLASSEPAPSLAPRDIQARIRAGDSADDVARIAGVPVDRVLRYAGPVLQERAMLAQHARRTQLKDSERHQTLAEVVDSRLGQHGIDLEKISWDAYRRDDGTWRIVATWPSGKATATATWELDRGRQFVAPQDDMAQYLCADRSSPIFGQETPRGHDVPIPSRREPGHGGHEPMLPTGDQSRQDLARPSRDPIRAGRDALLASLERPLASGSRKVEPAISPGAVPAPAVAGDASRRPAGVTGVPSAFEDDSDVPQEAPAVPSLAVLRPRRSPAQNEATPDKPRKRAPSWDDVLFGSAPAAKDA